MNGVFRYSKAIAGSLAVSLLALTGNYAQHWIFRSVDSPESSGIFLRDEFASASRSLSPQRKSDGVDIARWKVAVVTNRQETPPVGTESPLRFASSQNKPPTLLHQAIEAQLATSRTTYGFADVDVPLIRPRGQCHSSEEDSTPFVTTPLRTLDSASSFHEHIDSLLSDSDAKDVLVFVHGFNMTAKEAIARAAQISEDMPFHGVVIAFSWQSAGKTEAYLSDEKLAERNFWSLSELLAGLSTRFGSEIRLHILAHSMGNRVTLRALNALSGTIGPTGAPVDSIGLSRLISGQGPGFGAAMAAERTSVSLPSVVSPTPQLLRSRYPAWASWHPQLIRAPPLSSLVLAAPDVDAGEFQTFMHGIKHISQSAILYASDTDYALEASRRIHGGDYRAGDSRANMQINNLHVVRVSGVESGDGMGHSFYGSNPKVLNQLAQIFRPSVRLDQSIESFISTVRKR